MNIYDYEGSQRYSEQSEKYPDAFGSTDFMEKYYCYYSHLPSMYADKNPDYLIKVWERSELIPDNYRLRIPRFVVEISFAGGDFLCFNSTVHLLDYLTSILPMVDYHKKDHEEFEEQDRIDRRY